MGKFYPESADVSVLPFEAVYGTTPYIPLEVPMKKIVFPDSLFAEGNFYDDDNLVHHFRYYDQENKMGMAGHRRLLSNRYEITGI
jgi:hypothetical protein